MRLNKEELSRVIRYSELTDEEYELINKMAEAKELKCQLIAAHEFMYEFEAALDISHL